VLAHDEHEPRRRCSDSGAPSSEGDLLLRIYRVAATARALDERLWILARQGRAGFVLTARGHEVAQVASAAALRRGHDSAWPYYRDLGVGLALGVTPYEFLLGALGRADDPHTGSRQLSSHLSSPRLRLGSVSSEVSAHLPHAVGAAYAARVLGEDSVAVCWFGDGASSEGAAHEAMNLAGVQRLPVVFVCENNGWAISVPRELQMPVDSLAARAAGYGMPGWTIDGADPMAVFTGVRSAIDLARRGGGPSLLELRVKRMTAHSSQDDDAYRSRDELDGLAASDPLPPLRGRLFDLGVLSESADEDIIAEIHDDVLDAQQRALARPEPDALRARRWLYSGDAPHGGRLTTEGEPLPPGVFDG
jgi:2-oxoisovalerate dehydrogenase E1 component alpha subunit